MKIKVLFLTIIFSFPLFSFSNDISRTAQVMSIDDNSTDTLYVMGSGYRNIEGGGQLPFPPELVFIAEDIISFNPTTREIVLSDSIYSKFVFSAYDNVQTFYFLLYFYFNDKHLFDAMIVNRFNAFNDLVFYGEYDEDYHFFRFYLYDGYPTILTDYWPEEIKEMYLKEREDNAEKRKPEWDIFIAYLSDRGKIVGNTTAVKPVAAQESNAISIYPNPTRGELRIRNYELGIKSIRIFDLSGFNVFSTKQTSLDISYLPAGMYFVKITTEKGVVTKKIVKK